MQGSHSNSNRGPTYGSSQYEYYTYDAFGRRIIDAQVNYGFYYDGWQVVEVHVPNYSTTIQYQYVWSPVYENAMVERDQGSTRIYALQDANWDTTAIVNTAGSVLERFQYDPYGADTYTSGYGSGSGIDTIYSWRYLFQGGYLSTDGQYWFEHRDENASLGDWMEQDPAGYVDGMNRLQFETNAPNARLDPAGLTWSDNWGWFWDWVLERGDADRYYGPDDPSTQELKNSPAGDQMRKKFCEGHGAPIKNAPYDSVTAFEQTLMNPLNGTLAFVGGLLYDASSNPDGTVTYTAHNQVSIYSFFYHLPGTGHPDRGSTPGIMGNLNQTFQWTEPNSCPCPNAKSGANGQSTQGGHDPSSDPPLEQRISAPQRQCARRGLGTTVMISTFVNRRATQFLLSYILLGLSSGCSSRIDVVNLPGIYHCIYDYGSETLEIRRDGTFTQKISIVGKPPIVNSSTWQIDVNDNTIVLQDAIVTDDGFGRLRTDLSPARWAMSIVHAGQKYNLIENEAHATRFVKDN